MTFLGDMREALGRLAAFAELDVEAGGLPASLRALSDDAVRDLVDEVGRVATGWQTLQSLLAGVVAQRSTRDLGHGGLAAGGGFRTPVEMIRVMTGVTKTEATRAVKVGEALLAGAGAGAGSGSDLGSDSGSGEAVAPWHAALGEAMLAGRITQAQYDAIFHGLGEPPSSGPGGPGDDEVVDAWRAAAGELALEAPRWTVEQLREHARTLRDLLDEEGAQQRVRAHFEARSLRTWRDANGRRRADITFDAEGGEWFEALLGAALRPRRGGPRFVAEGEKEAAAALTDDPRSNEQLAYDLLFDLLRAGGLAEAKDVFGTREPGVRLVVVKDAVTGDDVRRDARGRLTAVGHTQDGGVAVDGATLERALCLGGHVEVVVDTCGRPLDVGREQRLFTVAQRIALATRDGGCLWPGCDRPPSMTEAHHCTPWRDGGATDVDDGVLLCRFHHVELHFRGWAIEGDGRGRFVLWPPGAGGARGGGSGSSGSGSGAGGSGSGGSGGSGSGAGAGGSGESRAGAIELRSKSPLRWLWDPPPDRPPWREAPAA